MNTVYKVNKKSVLETDCKNGIETETESQGVLIEDVGIECMGMDDKCRRKNYLISFDYI